MPTQVQELFERNLNNGMTAKDAAKDAQKRTGVALRTGKPPRRTQAGASGKIPGQFPRKLT